MATVETPITYRVWGIQHGPMANGQPGICLHLQNTGHAAKAVWVGDDDVLTKLKTLVNFDALTWGKTTKFEDVVGYKPELEGVVRGSRIYKIIDIREPKHRLAIADMEAYATSLGLITTNFEVQRIINDYVVRPAIPNIDNCKSRLDLLAKGNEYPMDKQPELIKDEQPVDTTPEGFHKDPFGNVAPDKVSVLVADGSRGRWFAFETKLMNDFGVEDEKETRDRLAHKWLDIGSRKNFKGNIEDAETLLKIGAMNEYPRHNHTRTILGELFTNAGLKSSAQNFEDATGYPNLEAALKQTTSPGMLYRQIEKWIKEAPVSPNAKQAQEGPKNDPSATPIPESPTASQEALQKPPETATNIEQPSADKFDIDPFLADAKTLMGIPALRIQEFVNRKYESWAYRKSKDFGKEITVIEPLAVRQRFDKIFGPHGIGWRIVPANESASTFLTPFTEATKSGERDMYQITISGYCMEYRMRIGETVEWQRTSAFTDSNDSNDAGYAGGGAFTGLMKQALKMLGGYDHFIIGELKAKIA